MKHTLLFILCIVLVSTTRSVAQNRIVENANGEAVLVPARGGDTTNGKRPCAVLNKSLRPITVRIQETVDVNNYVQKRTIVLKNLAPHEKRYVGTIGCENALMVETCKSYKIMLTYYEDAPPSTLVSAKAGTNGKSESTAK